jgi:hypothetical protein
MPKVIAFCLISALIYPLLSFAQVDSSLLLKSDGKRKPTSNTGRFSTKKPIDEPGSEPIVEPTIKLNNKIQNTLPDKKAKPAKLQTVDSLVSVVIGNQVTDITKDKQNSVKGKKPEDKTDIYTSANKNTENQKTADSNVEKSVDTNSKKDLGPEPGVGSDTKSNAEPDASPPTITQHVVDLVTGEGKAFIEAYKEQVHPDDIRLNQVELQINMGLHYQDSKSNYYFRNYTSYAPSYGLYGRFWPSPLIGFSVGTATTLGGDVSANNKNVTPAKHETNNLALEFRQFYGVSRKSPSIEYGFDFFDYKFEVSTLNTVRNIQKTSGVGVHAYARYPSSPNFSWVFGGKFFPRVNHAESPAAIEIYSGDGPSSSRISMSLGGEFKLTRQNQVIVDMTLTQDKHQYTGNANVTDPETAATPSGVSVIQSNVFFNLGYRWGQ